MSTTILGMKKHLTALAFECEPEEVGEEEADFALLMTSFLTTITEAQRL